MKTAKQIIAGITIYFTVIGQVFGQAALLPNAEQQYLDNNGNPLASGKVTYYVPGTTTKKTTWTNSTQTVSNTNPVNLDIGGKGIMYGQGSYRQVVQDNLGNIIWDQPTTAYGASQPSGATGTDTAPVGSILPYSGFVVPTNWQLAYGQALNRTTFAALMTTITISAPSIGCTNTSTTLTGFVDTSIIRIGAPIEATCLPTSTTVASITNATTIVVSQAAAATSTVTATIFPWGNGDQVLTFNAPDLRGRSAVGADCMGYVASGNACAGNLTTAFYGANPGAAGQTGGTQSKNLSIANINAFTPTGTISTITPAGSVSTTITGLYLQSGAGGGSVNTSGSAQGATNPVASSTFTGTPVTPTFTGGSLGSGTAHSVVNPDATVNYIIKVTPNSTGSGGVVSLGGMIGDITCDATMRCNNQSIGVAGSIYTALPASRLGTTVPLPNSPVYNNGTSGVGATLTSASNSTLTVDGTIANLNDAILVQNQASSFQNGIYTVTAAGSGSAPWVLTRATYFNQVSNMSQYSTTLVIAGVANINQTFVMSSMVTTVGTSPVVWAPLTCSFCALTNVPNNFTAPQTITSASASALAIGPTGSTNSVLNVDASTPSLAAGLNIIGAVTGGTVKVGVTDPGANTNVLYFAKGSGTFTIGGGVSTGAVTITPPLTLPAALTYGGVALSNSVTGTGSMVLSASPTLTGTLTASAGNFSSTLASAAHTITSASTSALAVGLNGATNPAFDVDASTALQAAGLKISGAATGGTVTVALTDPGSNTNLTINAKGTGTIGIGSVSSGTVTITPPLTLGAALTVPNGGTGLSSAQSGGVLCFNSTTTALSSTALGANGVVVGGGAGFCPGAIAAGTNGQLLLGVTSNAPQMATMSGDATIANTGAITLGTVNANVGTFGSATQASQVTVDAKGRITAVSNVTVTPAVGSITGLGTGVATLLGGTASGTGGPAGTASPTFTGTVAGAAANFSGALASAAHTITSASASCEAVGPNGSTNSALNIDCSAASLAAGLNIKGAATGGTVTVALTDPGSNTNLTINAKGTGTIGIGSVSSGTTTIGGGGGGATVLNSFTATGLVTYADMASAALATAAQYMAGTASTLVSSNIAFTSETTTTYGTTTTFDLSTFINTAVTLTGNITTLTLSNVKAGQAGTITFIQDGSGSHTSVWNSIFKFAGGATPTLSTAANAIDVLSYSCRSASICVAALIKDVR